MTDCANRARDIGVAAATEKYFDPLQPPNEIRIRSSGLFRFNSASWAKLPPNGLEGAVPSQAPVSRQRSTTSANPSAETATCHPFAASCVRYALLAPAI